MMYVIKIKDENLFISRRPLKLATLDDCTVYGSLGGAKSSISSLKSWELNKVSIKREDLEAVEIEIRIKQ